MPTSRERRTLIIVSLALFMVVLDNLVVSVALASIHRDFGSSVQSLEWTVNAYTLCYAVFLLDRRDASATASAAGACSSLGLVDLHGRLARSPGSRPTPASLIAARAIQGIGAPIVTPLTLTLLAETFAAERRGLALGVWSGISGTAVALGPLVGGAVIAALNWHWIFGINVPIGLLLVPVAARTLRREPRPQREARPTRASRSAASACSGIVFGLVHAQTAGFGAAVDDRLAGGGGVLLVAFVLVELRAAEPMLPMCFFAHRAFVFTNIAHVRDVLRHVRRGLLPLPVPPARARQLGAPGRV